MAICDSGQTIASPLTVIQGQKELLKKIAEVVETENVEAVVLGLPLNMDDSEGPQSKLVLKFAEQLKGYLHIPVHLQDEACSTSGLSCDPLCTDANARVVGPGTKPLGP